MKDNSSFIKEQFANYYKGINSIEEPSSIKKREFGFFLFKKGVIIRHKAFSKVEELKKYVSKIVPAHAYYSAAYYSMPERKMEDKEWLGSDLYFDIDADHIQTGCDRDHDSWICSDCKFRGKGISPKSCPNCGGKRFNIQIWPCKACLEGAKQETSRLIDILKEDFGFLSEEIYIAFTGHRGYHVQVEEKTIRELDSVSRKEMVDYVTGEGLEAIYHGFTCNGKSRIITGPLLSSPGWGGRIAKATNDFFSEVSENELKEVGLWTENVWEVISDRNRILESWTRKGPWAIINRNIDDWKEVIMRGIKSNSSKIDTVVTTDIHRLIRLPKSLHGKTGFLKTQISTEKIIDFDPFKEAIAFKKNFVTVYVEESPQFRIGDTEYGPFKKSKEELPMAAALYLLCKGAADVLE